MDDITGFTDRWAKCLDAAAVRIGVEPDLMMQMKRRRIEKALYDNESKRYKKSIHELPFLINNIGLIDEDEVNGHSAAHDKTSVAYVDKVTPYVIEPELEALERMSEEEKRVTFQAFYKKELQRQRSIFFQTQSLSQSFTNGIGDENMIAWIDG